MFSSRDEPHTRTSNATLMEWTWHSEHRRFSHLGIRSSTQITVFWQTKALLWPSSFTSAEKTRLLQHSPHSRPRLHCVNPSSSPFADNSLCPRFPLFLVLFRAFPMGTHCRLGMGGGYTAATVFIGQCAQPNWANSVEPQAWQECGAPTHRHTHICNPTALPDSTHPERRASNTF